MSLGHCEKCHGELCMSGRLVTCERCGQPHPDHPAAKAWAEEAKLPPRPQREAVVLPQDYPASVPDRVLALERQLADALKRLTLLEQGGRKRAAG